MNVLNLPIADQICQIFTDNSRFYKRFSLEYSYTKDRPQDNCIKILVKDTKEKAPSVKQNPEENNLILNFPPKKFKLLDLLYLTETTFAQTLIFNKILLLHASSFIYQNRGYVFCGPGGVGKSTIIKLSSDIIPLSDDTTVIKKIDRQYYIYASPFDKIKCGKIKSKKILLHKIFILRIAKKTQIVSFPYSQAVQKIINNSLLHFFGSTESHQRLFKFCLNLAATIPIGKLYFTKTPEFLKLLDAKSQ